MIPKKIIKLGFIKKKKEGYVSQNKKDINYKGGVLVKKVDKNKIHLDGNFVTNDNKYFFLKRNSQTSYMFRITYLE